MKVESRTGGLRVLGVLCGLFSSRKGSKEREVQTIPSRFAIARGSMSLETSYRFSNPCRRKIPS